MMLKRGPQWVQLVKGYEWRRLVGSNTSARQAGQVARSGMTKARFSPPRWPNFEVDVAHRIQKCRLQTLDEGDFRLVAFEPTQEFAHRWPRSFDIDEHALRRVVHPTIEPQIVREPKHERPKPTPWTAPRIAMRARVTPGASDWKTPPQSTLAVGYNRRSACNKRGFRTGGVMATESFKASRWTRGNLFFPTILEINETAVIRRKRSLSPTAR